MQINIDHECDDGLMLQLTFEYTKGYPAVMYLNNGDPGYPGEPDFVELVDVKHIDDDGKVTGDAWKTWPEKWSKTMADMYWDDVAENEREEF